MTAIEQSGVHQSGLIDVGTAVYKAADARDARAVASLTERVDASCTSCHKKFRTALFAPTK